MNNSLIVTFKEMERTEPMTSFIENRFERLRRVAGNIIRCAVTVSAPHRSHRQGNAFEVTVDLRIPGRELIGKARSNMDEGTDLYTAISRAFHSLSKQLTPRRRHSTPPLFKDMAPLQRAQSPVERMAASA